MDCTNNCLSKHHGKYLTSAVTSEDIETLKTILKEKCSNALRNPDLCGRTILHICASVGRYDVLSWICDEWKTTNILQTKDKESGWTALHRALYYGHIDCAILIYKVVQDWHAVDAEGHSPLDLLVLDSPRTKKMKNKKERLAVVVLPFESGEAGELTLHSGDVVEILNTNRSGWAVGRLQGNNGGKGLFPFNFVEEIKQDAPVEPCIRFKPTNDIYVWGNNVNYALGLGDSKNRANPEHLWLEKRSIKHCVVTKFHSVFLTECGNIFTCGHGLGGRLGHENEETVLHPMMISYFENIHCTAIDAAYSHTIVLDELGQVYTFGFNDFHQLGHSPPPSSCSSPKQIIVKSLKNRTILGVAAGRFHSVIYTKHEIYTFGLNAGQLGHQQGDKLITTPKLVSHLYKKEVLIISVVASDGATVCLLANGDLYLFQDYVCRKIALRLFDVSNITITGGMLQCSDLESFNKPQPLQIAILHNSGVVEVWRSGFNSLKMCYWLGQKLTHSKIIHISLGLNLILTTDAGQVYCGHFLNKNVNSEIHTNSSHVNITPKKVEVQSATFTLSEIMEKHKKERSECEEVNLVKLPLLYHCVKCFSDSKSRTFAAIQCDARIGLRKYPSVQTSKMTKDVKQLFKNASLDDDIHDAVIKIKSQNIPVHRFILECRLNDNDLDIHKSNVSDEKKIIYNFSCNQKDTITWLEKVYIGENTTATPLKMDNKENLNIDDILFAKNMPSLALVDFEGPLDDNILNNGLPKPKKKSKKKSAYAVHQEKSKCAVLKSSEVTKGNPKPSKEILTLGTFHNWRNFKDLSDVTIESEDGCLFHCHKCILRSRAEYFNNMLSSTWIESSICKGGTLKIPIPENILDVVINFLYTDEANSFKEITDATFIGEVLICADQLLLTRLKDICELELADKVCLKNAIEIFQFAWDYSVEQLKKIMCEFISLNLPYFLEAKLLEYLSDECLQLLSREYRDMVVGMESRIIEPSQQHRITDELEKSMQETVINDLNKLKSKRGRLSSSRSKSVSSMSESDLENSICVHQLANDVFEKTPPSSKNESNQTKEQFVNGTKKVSNSVDHVNGVASKNKTGVKSPKGEQSKSINGVKSLTEDHSPSLKGWNVNNQRTHSSHSLSEDFTPDHVVVTPKKGITPFKKKSQKDRKREQLIPAEQPNDEQQENVEVAKPVICPWVNTTQKTPQVSFREVLSEETPPLNQNIQPKRRSVSFPQELKQERKSGNPWRSPSECQESESSSFVNIIHVQQEEKKQLTEQSKRPLSVIQLEEKAIEELLKHYEMVADQGEYITIKRIKPVTATPFWEVDVNK